MTDYDAVVYDLDGTLVHLAVDWNAVRGELRAALDEHGLDATNTDVWGLFELAESTGHGDVAEDVIGRHELSGARTADRLPLADELPLSVPVGVCSLNCEDACRIALETHDLLADVDAISGRDSGETYKPDPRHLAAVVDELGVGTDRALFVGDSGSDRETAEAAGVDFQRVRNRLDAR